MNKSTQSLRRTLVGRVVSDKMQKTVTVQVERQVRHPVIGKYVSKSKKYHAHDETNQYKMGDTVEITEGKPMAKTKAWVVTRLVESSKGI